MRFSLGIWTVALLLLLHFFWVTRAAGFLALYRGKHGRGVHGLAPAAEIAFAAEEKEEPAPRIEKMHIVLTHYSKDTLEETAKWWEGFISIQMVQDLQPAVYVYCQNPNISDLGRLTQLLRYGGKLEHLDNLGRESHAFLHHIVTYYDRLPRHVLFSQDIPVEVKLWHRFQKMFVPETGFLPLAVVGHQTCNDQWLPAGLMQQLYAMLTRRICPPEGFTGAYNGQFVVSRQRLRAVDWWTYKHLLELVAAPRSHWIHDTHNNTFYKNPENPYFGHVLERSWTLAFDCYESWRHANCYDCDNERAMDNCGPDACQCLDRRPEN